MGSDSNINEFGLLRSSELLSWSPGKKKLEYQREGFLGKSIWMHLHKSS